jgi:hypothetical protein
VLHNYLDFVKESLDHVNEGSEKSPTYIYWDNKLLEDLLDKEWTNITVTKLSDKYSINFKAGNDQYNYYGVIVANKNGNDFFYLEHPEKFIPKFKNEFWKKAYEYVKNMKYDPKCLGSLQHVRDSEKYNL